MNWCAVQGGFAKCFELTDVKSSKTYAGKVIAKTRIVKTSQKDKVGWLVGVQWAYEIYYVEHK